MKLPENLNQKLENRKQSNALRQLPNQNNLIDFTSNDYIGFSKSETIFKQTHQYLIEKEIAQNGATGSRLISGNHSLYPITENFIAQFHDVESALIFNSGYDANVGFFSAVPQRNDVILYDELSHASIRDGIVLSNAKSYKFNHNDFEDLERLIIKFRSSQTQIPTIIYIVTETVFSMDGDCPNLEELVLLSDKYNCYLVVDEAHTLGVFGAKGEGLAQYLNVQDRIFARIMTFGKGLGCHGAAILGSAALKEYLVNFARSFIYTTGLSPHAVATILTAYQQLTEEKETIDKLRNNIVFFNQQKNLLGLKPMFVRSKSAIQSAIIPGNEKVKQIAHQLRQKGFDVKPILSPTVPEGQERLRFCIHSYNSEAEIFQVLELLRDFVF
ncbi:pyridoxal phosphate-dependent aminotransferase family protein [Flavobacterium sp. Fl-77]|uniref:Pyridoxal phosphate-dependent aminotransferase family protein n=1 Tax=Flavobacterium flavipigmentatum TaxID=2893884 RepID=A0AAJ2SDM8_9FLAO|nr:MULTISPECIES: pyridoxal phosphate-dependent aminotransferase family protein [unclassified Flavobacterium]MDX6180819.1 pyridoxal phosphate-dependent aminotransferase family protein [Flavobacterium sp. Fl-33]MDX6184419.1 pyridoxal phosphate-dependent aminotransferase family protein [Flavobacterium sp. Fl-77]UFH39528.1 pyridoxal phosphate-dependent aminotransferase family protein [Flavobacterium sp. F-70]